MVGLTGFEPATYASQTQRSSQVELQSDKKSKRRDLHPRMINPARGPAIISLIRREHSGVSWKTGGSGGLRSRDLPFDKGVLFH